MATYLFALFILILPSAWAPVPAEGFKPILLMLSLVTLVLPAINIYLFRMLGTISSVQMPRRKERVLPFVFISVMYCAVTYMFHEKVHMDWGDNFFRFLVVIDALVVVGTVITFFYKISIHSLALGGIVGILLPLNKVSEEIYIFYATLGAIVLAGVVMSARLQLQAHTLREVLLGGLLGLFIGFGGVILLFFLPF
jgi:hypothetical protein